MANLRMWFLIIALWIITHSVTTAYRLGCDTKDSERIYNPRPLQSRCETKGMCWDPHLPNLPKCYLKSSDECYVPPNARRYLKARNIDGCTRKLGCWDYYETNKDNQCYQRNFELGCDIDNTDDRIYKIVFKKSDCQKRHYCWDRKGPEGRQCYLKKHDRCYVLRQYRTSVSFSTWQNCLARGFCFDGYLLPKEQNMCYTPFTESECAIDKVERIPVVEEGHTQDPNGCENRGYCWDGKAPKEERCYMKEFDVCNVQPEDREAIPRDNPFECRRVGGCWDTVHGSQAQCYFKDRYCKKKPYHCKLEDRSLCQYNPGQICGLGNMTDIWRCYHRTDDQQKGSYDDFTVERQCCRAKCPVGNNGKSPSPVKPKVTCMDVWPLCEEDQEQQQQLQKQQ